MITSLKHQFRELWLYFKWKFQLQNTNYRIKVKSNTTLQYKFHSGEIASAYGQSNQMFLLDLDDDCLFTIFEGLSLEDLTVVDQVCVKFQAIAQLVYRRQRHYEINIRTERNLSGAVLQRIGFFLESLQFTCGFLIVPTAILRNVVQYCTNLRRLKLQYITLGDVDVPVLDRLFSQLEELDLSGVRITAAMAYQLNAPNLKMLRLHFVENRYEEQFLVDVKHNPGISITKYPNS